MKETEKHKIPPGYHFVPSEEELILHYLGNKLNGLPLPSNMVVFRDLYGDESPWEVFTDDDPWESKTTREKNSDNVKVETTIYAITELKKVTENRVSRTVGCGAWHETGSQVIYDSHNNRKIGSKRIFAFEITEEDYVSINQGHWIMHELTSTLDGAKFAICEIKREHSKRTKIAPKNRMKKKEGNSREKSFDAVVATAVTELEEREKEVESRKRGLTVFVEDNNIPQRKKMCYDLEDIVEAESNPNAMPRLEDVGELCDDHQPCLESDYSMISAQTPMVQESQCLPPNTALLSIPELVPSMEQPMMSSSDDIDGVTDVDMDKFFHSLPEIETIYKLSDDEDNQQPCLNSVSMISAQMPMIDGVTDGDMQKVFDTLPDIVTIHSDDEDNQQPCLKSVSMSSAHTPMIQESQCLPPNTALLSLEEPVRSMNYLHEDVVGVKDTVFEPSPEFETLPNNEQNDYRPHLDSESNPESGLMSGAQLPTIQESSQFLPPNTALDRTTTASDRTTTASLIGEFIQSLSSEIDSNTNFLSIDETEDILLSPLWVW